LFEYYLAIDIGASGGRHILGHMENGRLVIEEVYRFENEAVREGTHLLWDTDAIFTEICTGLEKCAAQKKIPISTGIDTWGVDYVLLDKNKDRIGKTYAYRDQRTERPFADLEDIISTHELYNRTGIQKMPINTIYQLIAHKEHNASDLDSARYFLMIPDYFHFLLTGEIVQEYTNASTTQLLDVHARSWDRELISKLGINDEIFMPLSVPGTRIGKFSKEVENRVGFTCSVILPATHDTGSAVMAVPATGENSIYLSSGTWSLMGCEIAEPITTQRSMEHNFTNEGGYDYRYRYLKNIMGLWMTQSLRKELPEKPSYIELSQAAEKAGIDTTLDCNDNRFLSPESMIKEIRDCCAEHGFDIPQTTGELAAVIYNSLAASYKKTCAELGSLTGKNFDTLHIIGGGSQNRHMNKLTVDITGMSVHTGPSEATAIGNIMAQMIARGVFNSLEEARSCVRESFEIDVLHKTNSSSSKE